MRVRYLAVVVVAALLGSVACDRAAKLGSGGERSTAAAGGSALAEARTLLEQGQLEAALAKLQDAPGGPDRDYTEGAVWAKKAETAPLPTPPAPSLPRGAEPLRAARFKPEELKALDFFEKAVAARPDHPQANLAIAELLAPYAMRQFDVAEGSRRAVRGKRGSRSAPVPATRVAGEPDFSPERVVNAYRMAAVGDAAAKAPVEALISFAGRVGRMQDVDSALQEMVKRDRESAEPLVRYGDFLLSQKQDATGAVTQYRQALIWRADDDATRAKIADIYISMGARSYANQQYAVAETQFLEAQKYVTDKSSPQGQKVQEHLSRLGAIRRH